jgi:hypothetical protein
MSAIERLLERLQTGWAPETDDIDRDIQQFDLLDWGWWTYFNEREMFLAGSDLEGALVSGPVLWIDPGLEYALCESGFYWLYDDQESEKVRYLGG